LISAAQASNFGIQAQSFAGLQENSLGLLQKLYDLLLYVLYHLISRSKHLIIDHTLWYVALPATCGVGWAGTRIVVLPGGVYRISVANAVNASRSKERLPSDCCVRAF